MVIPARASACLDASTGPSPMISGDSADTPVDTIRASGVMPRSAALRSLMITTAAAPSLSGQQLPAVTVPSGRNTGCSVATFSSVVPARGPSSAVTTVPSGRVSGVMSRCQKPLASAFSARFCDRTPNSSCACRVMPRNCATFSAVWPIAMYTSGISPSSRGSCQSGAPAPERTVVRSCAPAKTGFCVSGQLSLLPLRVPAHALDARR